MLLQDFYKDDTVFRFLAEQDYNVAVTFDTDEYVVKVRVTGSGIDETAEKSVDSNSDDDPPVDFLEVVEELLTVVLINLSNQHYMVEELLENAKHLLTEERKQALYDKGWGIHVN